MKVVYSISNNPFQLILLNNSLKTIRRFVDKKDIVISLTPPFGRLERVYRRFTVMKHQNHLFPEYIYGDKIYGCDVDDDIVIFMDNDTEIKKDITELIDFKEDIFIRRDDASDDYIGNHFRNIKKKLGIDKDIPMWNTGFIIFRNKTHQKIKSKWIEYLSNYLSGIWKVDNKNSWIVEQLAFSLASHRYSFKEMSAKEHLFKDTDLEKDIETYVVHYRKLKREYVHILSRI